MSELVEVDYSKVRQDSNLSNGLPSWVSGTTLAVLGLSVAACTSHPAEQANPATPTSEELNPTTASGTTASETATAEKPTAESKPTSQSPEATATPTAEDIRPAVVKYLESQGIIGSEANLSEGQLVTYLPGVIDRALVYFQVKDTDQYIVVNVTDLSKADLQSGEVDYAEIVTTVTKEGATQAYSLASMGGSQDESDVISAFKKAIATGQELMWKKDSLEPNLDNAQLIFNQEKNRLELVQAGKVLAYVDPMFNEWIPNSPAIMGSESNLVLPLENGRVLRYVVDPRGKNQWELVDNMVAVDGQVISYEGNRVVVGLGDNAQEITFPAEITEVTARGESLKVTLADGTEKTLTQDKETGEWEINVMRKLTEVDVSTEEGMQMAQKAVADALAGGIFMDEAEIKAKIEAGELKVVRDEKTGAVIVFPKQALDYLKGQGQSVESSDAARLFQTLEGQNQEVFSKWTEAKYFEYGEYYQKRLNYPEDLQTFAERLAQSGGFLPLTPEWMTFTVRLDQANQPEVIAILPQFLDPWDRSYPAGKRIFGNPIKRPADKRLVLGVKLWLEDDGQVKKQFIQAPFITQYRGQQLTLEPEANELVNRDEYQTVTHKLGEEKRQWHELKEYEVYGTARERLVQILTYKVFEEKRMVDSKEHTNVFGLDKEKVQAMIDVLGDEEKSIEEINANEAKAAGIYILTDAEGNPAQIAIVGGEYGLSQEHIAALIKAHNAINETDPNEIYDESIKGTKFISMGTSFIMLEKNDIRVSSSDTDVVIGKKSEDPTIRYWIDLLISESREVDGTRRSLDNGRVMVPGDDTVYKNFGHYAMTKALEWFNTHGNELVQRGYITQKDLSEIKGGIEYNLERYKNAN